jgi:uncharacterized OB-fold protein
MSEHASLTDSDLYWDRVRGLGFALPRCLECDRFHFYPRPACPFCGSDSVAPTLASGKGTVYSYSVVYRAPKPVFADDVPYAVAIVATDEGPHLMTRIIGMDPTQVRTGMRVRVCRRSTSPEPMFEPDEENI